MAASIASDRDITCVGPPQVRTSRTLSLALDNGLKARVREGLLQEIPTTHVLSSCYMHGCM